MKIIRINAVWCSGCLVMNKVWKEVEQIYPQLEIINYDYDMDYDFVKELKVGDVLPVAIFYHNNNEIKRLIGEKSKQEIIMVINKIEEVKNENN
ncbi:MAG: thioredoxin family protein [Bacilli bacterium]|nr:thioredoxin family protein [Bacilli bacterium]MDD4809340.1 thioredoxin family protein [Bacilli bacterium]